MAKYEYFDCCNHEETTKYQNGYVMIKPIRIKYCKNCGTVHIIANWFWSLVFEKLLIYFWDGKVNLYPENEDGKITLEEAMYFEEI